MNNKPHVGEKREIVEPVKTLCCSGTLGREEVCEIERILSPNRLLVKSIDSGNYHKVKRSTFMSNSQEVKA